MLRLVAVNTESNRLNADTEVSLSPLSFEELRQHAPDAHWQVDDGRQTVARGSLWWRKVPSLPGETLGIIGHYAAAYSASGALLLEHACVELRARGCTLAVGPMDGSTWRRYRLVTERGDEPPFLLEPDNPNDWPDHFTESGFTPLARYLSSLNTRLDHVDPRLPSVRARLTSAGVAIRPIEMGRIDEELRRIHQLSAVSFQHNYLYTPLAEQEFLAQYRSSLPWIVPELALMAERGDTLVGFLFALPDLLQAQRGRRVDTVVLKTVAILPERDYAGLGGLLAAYCHRAAQELGYTRVIHALMHEANRSRHTSNLYALPIRRYTLYARRLADVLPPAERRASA